MPRKGKKRDIMVFGVVLEGGRQINHTDEGIVSIYANGDKTVSITDGNSTKTTILDENGEPALWTNYVPRFN